MLPTIRTLQSVLLLSKMHFIQFLAPLSLLRPTLCLAMPSTSEWVDRISKPLKPISEDNQLLAPHGEPGKRQILEELQTAIDIGSIVMDVISDIVDDQETTEINFVASTVDTLRAQFPDMNILVYHDQDSGYNLHDYQYTHVEVDLNNWFGTTKGYEVFVFDHGSFDLAGDGGFSNWRIWGCFSRNDNHVDFSPISTC
ncbi:hypothetical protein F4803DRAFT_529673 [Xylaria telfairii]|nr:hypothetical protein F4803DRAFT_529673 [Xylaria telfairii]